MSRFYVSKYLDTFREERGRRKSNDPLRCRRGLTPGGPPFVPYFDPNGVGVRQRQTRPGLPLSYFFSSARYGRVVLT